MNDPAMNHRLRLTERVIAWSLNNRFLVLAGAVCILAFGLYSLDRLSLDAIPDVSDVQVIIRTSYAGQSPQTVEDQVTYPLTSVLLSVPRSTAVRGFSMFGDSYIYVIFEDGTDPYWARARVLEYLNQATSRLPPGLSPVLGPDASGVGWIYEYALVDRHHRYDPDEIRAVQDFYLKYELQSVAGVAEVASVGGMVRQYQVEVDPNRLAAYNVSLDRVGQAIRDANMDGGGSAISIGGSEFMIRSRGLLRSLTDFENIDVGMDARAVPIRLTDVARLQLGPEMRRGIAELNGDGEVTGGIVVMRQGQNALSTIQAVKSRIQELKRGLPSGLEMVPVYDRSELINNAVHSLSGKLIEESIAVTFVCMIFLLHLRSSAVVFIVLPVAILLALTVMRLQGVTANIMSLGGIAIAVGALVDAAIVMIENMHKHLEKEGSNPDYVQIARRSALEVGPALFFSLLIITVSFFPIFGLNGQEGKLFTPLALTKSYAMAAGALLAITLAPVLMTFLIRGRILPESRNPINRFLQALYRPVLAFALNHRAVTVGIAGCILLSSLWPLLKTGSEFMPPLYEGDILYMPTARADIPAPEASKLLQYADQLIRGLPEVNRVFGKAGRADSATDPAPLSMFETTISLKPREAWPPGETVEDFIKKLDRTVRVPGLTNSWGYPIRTRIDMLSTGVRSAVAVRITGQDLAGINQMAQQIAAALKGVPGTRSAFADRGDGGRYLDITTDRLKAAQYGLNVADVQRVVQSAIGGDMVSTLLNGRETFPISVRYPREYRDSLQAVGDCRLTTPSGGQVSLRDVAEIAFKDGPMEIRSENGRLATFVYADVEARDLGGYVIAAKEAVSRMVPAKPGYDTVWTGQYENLEHARQHLAWAMPLTLGVVALLLYFQSGQVQKVLLILLCLPFSIAGGLWVTYLLGYNFSVAVAVGFIALAGVSAEFGVVMLIYLDLGIDETTNFRLLLTPAAIREGIVKGALLRLRPKSMTVAVILAGLLPMFFSQGAGVDVMRRIAAPLVGGMITAPLLSLVVIPVLYDWLQCRRTPASTLELASEETA
jgi:Cu(I)/Ag(I) efflux system membrane protein CusA/SilA